MAIRQNVLNGCIAATTIDSKPKLNADEVIEKVVILQEANLSDRHLRSLSAESPLFPEFSLRA